MPDLLEDLGICHEPLSSADAVLEQRPRPIVVRVRHADEARRDVRVDDDHASRYRRSVRSTRHSPSISWTSNIHQASVTFTGDVAAGTFTTIFRRYEAGPNNSGPVEFMRYQTTMTFTALRVR